MKPHIDLSDATSEQLGDRDFVMAAVGVLGANLFYAEKWQNDLGVVEAAVENWAQAFAVAHPKLQDNNSIAYSAIGKNWEMLQYASKRLRNTPHLVSAAIEQNYRALGFASLRIKHDPEVVLSALKKDVRSIEFASEPLQEIAALFVDATPKPACPPACGEPANVSCVVKNASEAPLGTREDILKAVQHDGNCLFGANEFWKDDYEVVKVAVANCPSTFTVASSSLKNDISIALSAVQQDWKMLQYAGENLKNAPELVLVAVRQDLGSIRFASDRLQEIAALLQIPKGIKRIREVDVSK